MRQRQVSRPLLGTVVASEQGEYASLLQYVPRDVHARTPLSLLQNSRGCGAVRRLDRVPGIPLQQPSLPFVRGAEGICGHTGLETGAQSRAFRMARTHTGPHISRRTQTRRYLPLLWSESTWGEQMDAWLTNDLKEAMSHACIQASRSIATRLNARLQRRQSIDERALTEDLVDHMDTRTQLSVWGAALAQLRSASVSLSVGVEKSTQEHLTGADIGFVVDRHAPGTQARYAALVQCKKVGPDGRVGDFFHQVGGKGRHQSDLLLSITPSSFYFVFPPPALVSGYLTAETIAFIVPSPEHHVPIWNMGCFGGGTRPSLIPAQSLMDAAAVMVVPALAVEADQRRGSRTTVQEIVPNAVPFWYWFAELLVPGFIGDPRQQAVAVAVNTAGDTDAAAGGGVNFSVQVSLGVEG